MTNNIRYVELSITLTRFLDVEPQPGIVEAQIYDVDGICWTFVDKWPIFTTESDPHYPSVGQMRCQVLDERMVPGQGRELLISTDSPRSITTPDGEYASFWVHEEQIAHDPPS